MRRLVFDEWLWADLAGENGQQAQRRSFELLEAVLQKCDQLVTVKGSPFVRKFYDLAKRAGTAKHTRSIVRVFRAYFLENSQKLRLMEEAELGRLPAEVELTVKPDDQYLVRACIAAQAELLVSTDEPLIQTLRRCGIACQDRAAFLAEYLQPPDRTWGRRNGEHGTDRIRS